MKKISIIIISFFLVFKTSFANTYSSDPKSFVTELVNDAISKLSNKDFTKDEKSKFIEKIALENVDIKALGLYTLGDIRKSTGENNLKKYQTAFEKYFLKSLTSRLTDYSSNRFEVISADKKSSNYTIVISKLAENQNQPEIKITISIKNMIIL